MPSGIEEDLLFTLAVSLNGQVVDYITFRAHYVYGEKAYRTARGDGIEAVSDGDVSITGEGLILRDVSVLHLALPSGTSYIVKLNGTQIRSGEIQAGDKVIVGISFDQPVSGLLTYEPVRTELTRLSGSGEVSVSNWLTIESPGSYDVSLMSYQSNPMEYAAPEGVRIIKVFAIDVLRAMRATWP